MANSNFDTSMKRAGQAVDEQAQQTGRSAAGLYDQAKSAASDAYDSASEMAQDAMSRAQDTAADLDDVISEQVGRHPKAMVALGVGLGFLLGVLYASTRTPEPPPRWSRWR